MIFADLLAILRFRNPDQKKIDFPLDDSEELIKRIEIEHFSLHREWSNQELINLFKSRGANLNLEIPCKHCAPSGQR